MYNIVILTAGFGNGHNTAASGIKRQLELENKKINKNKKNKIKIIDIAETYFAGKILKFIFENANFWFLKKIYTQTNNIKYSWFDKIFINLCFYNLNKKLKKLQNNSKNLEIYITFPMLQLLNICFEKNVKTIIQVTDFYTPHFSWAWNSENISEIRVLDAHAKMYILKNLQKKNINNIRNIRNIRNIENIYDYKNLEKKIKISEFPLILKQKDKQNFKNKTILCFFHSVLLGNEEKIIKKIIESEKYKNYKIVILAGKNKNILQKILKNKSEKFDTYSKISILGWVNKADIFKYYNNAEIVVGKCGGAFLAEIIKLQKKVIITGIFSEQEKGNFEYITKNHSHLIIEL